LGSLYVVDLKFAMAAVCHCDWVGKASMYVFVDSSYASR
jgi:hypothetical protein